MVSFLAGVLTVLAPCILPLLPVVIGSSVGGRSKVTPFVVIGSLALSVLFFTYILKASTALISIPTYVWGYVSGSILLVFGLVLLFPSLWERLSFVRQTSVGANKLVGEGHQKKSIWGDVLVGAALGPVFSSCSPTYFVILATVLPASFFLGTLYLLAYIAGLVSVLILIALLGQRVTSKLQLVADSHGWFKRGLGLLFLIVGLFIFTGFDKKVETWVLERGYIDGVLQFEQNLLEDVQSDAQSEAVTVRERETVVDVPRSLAQSFPETDFSKTDPDITNAISGGPAKDGIPAIDEPTFVPLGEFNRPDTVQAIVLVGESETKVYPYNILTWHEIVNDEIDDVPVAVTFCPLCGSAIVFERTLPDGTVSTFGVSGSLLESNMIMYDRETENLWQQSTGKVLAGAFFPAQLELVSFQLMNLGEIRSVFPEAMVLSENTGHRRDYARNPYAGYETDNRFVFDPSDLDTTFDPKEIMVVWRTEDAMYTTPWQSLRTAGGLKYIGDTNFSLTLSDSSELTITDDRGGVYPFYFEMWFSVAIQNEDLVVVE